MTALALTDIYNVDDESRTEEEEEEDDDSLTSQSCDDSWTLRSGDEIPDDDVLVYNDISNSHSDDNIDDGIGDEFDVALFQEVTDIVPKYNNSCNPDLLPKSFWWKKRNEESETNDSSNDNHSDDIVPYKEPTWDKLSSEEGVEYADWQIDVTIGGNFEKASYLVHRFKLGPRSDYFQSVFNEKCNFAGSREHRCTIRFPVEMPIDVTFDHFERFLDYFYLDAPLEWNEGEFLSLLYLADYFCVNDLREHTLELVRYNIVRTCSCDWMAQAYQLAETLSIQELIEPNGIAKALSKPKPSIIQKVLVETMKQEIHLERELKRRGLLVSRLDYKETETSAIAEALHRLKPTLWEIEVFLAEELRHLIYLRFVSYFSKWTVEALKNLLKKQGIGFASNETKNDLIAKIMEFY